MVLLQKWLFFQLFFLGNIGKENIFYDILQKKNAFLGYKNKQTQRVEKLTFWSKNSYFFNFFFLGNIAQENLYYDILEQKNAFLGYKIKKLKKWKN